MANHFKPAVEGSFRTVVPLDRLQAGSAGDAQALVAVLHARRE